MITNYMFDLTFQLAMRVRSDVHEHQCIMHRNACQRTVLDLRLQQEFKVQHGQAIEANLCDFAIRISWITPTWIACSCFDFLSIVLQCSKNYQFYKAFCTKCAQHEMRQNLFEI